MEISLKFTNQQMVYLQIAINELPEKPRTELIQSINVQMSRQQSASGNEPGAGGKSAET